MTDTDRNSIALPVPVTDPDARVRAAFDAARRMLGQLEINRLALSVSNIKAQTINVDHAERLIREDACGVLDWLAGALGVEVRE